MTKKLLNDYRRLHREIPLLETELQEMLTTDAGLASSTILDYRRGYGQPQSVVGFDWELYDMRQRILETKQEKAKEVEEWIESIEDVETRWVFRMKYMEGLSWVQIARKTGYGGNIDYPRLYIRDKYLKKCGIR